MHLRLDGDDELDLVALGWIGLGSSSSNRLGTELVIE